MYARGECILRRQTNTPSVDRVKHNNNSLFAHQRGLLSLRYKLNYLVFLTKMYCTVLTDPVTVDWLNKTILVGAVFRLNIVAYDVALNGFSYYTTCCPHTTLYFDIIILAYYYAILYYYDANFGLMQCQNITRKCTEFILWYVPRIYASFHWINYRTVDLCSKTENEIYCKSKLCYSDDIFYYICYPGY